MLYSLDRVTKVPNRTIENLHKRAIHIIQELLNRTNAIPGTLTKYQSAINIQIENLSKAQEDQQQQRIRKRQNEQER